MFNDKWFKLNDFSDLPVEQQCRYTRSPTGSEIKSYISLITGAQSSGKSYACTRLIWRYLRRGYRVAANFDVAWGGFCESDHFFLRVLVWLGFKRYLNVIPKSNFIRLSNDLNKMLLQVERLGNCLVFVDEEYELFNSRSGMSGKSTKVFLQTNKRGVTLYVVTPYANLVDKVLRVSAKEIIKCFSFDLFKRTLFFRHEYHRIDDSTDDLFVDKDSYKRFLVFPNDRVYGLYSTGTTVGISKTSYILDSIDSLELGISALYSRFLFRPFLVVFFSFVLPVSLLLLYYFVFYDYLPPGVQNYVPKDAILNAPQTWSDFGSEVKEGVVNFKDIVL